MTLTAPIRVRVLLFAVQRQLAGAREVALELPAPADIAAAWDALVDQYPVLAPGRSSVRFARNGTYADASEPLADGDEVAMIPPVSGGANESRILELREEPFEAGILESLTARRGRAAGRAAAGCPGGPPG